MKQTPAYLMTPGQMQQMNDLTKEISALKEELHHLMVMDNDI
jgi:hypothetical protein